jgi:hypothetical protein
MRCWDVGPDSCRASTMLSLGVAQILIWGEHDTFVPRALAEQSCTLPVKPGIEPSCSSSRA